MTKSKKFFQEGIIQALANNEFVFYYQPIISLVTGKTHSVEALIRWIRPDGSVVLPSSFIPQAEKTGFITKITQAMLPKLMADINAIHQVEPSLIAALNISARDITRREPCIIMPKPECWCENELAQDVDNDKRQ
ncbi:MAG: EAL domain-containing protein [Chloroflexota bacterium]